jgi:cytidylate kinase
MGESVSLARLLADIEERDARDRTERRLHWLQPRTRLSLTALPLPLMP